MVLLLLLACLGEPDPQETELTASAATESEPASDTEVQDTEQPPADPWSPAADCAVWPEGSGTVVSVSPGDDLMAAVAALETGDTLSFADGTYELDGDYLWLDTPGVTLRGASGDADAVVLDGGFSSTEILSISAEDVVVTDLTLFQAWTHGVHVVGGGHGVVLHRIVVLDPGQQAVKVNTSSDGSTADDGVLSCSRLEMTDNSRDNAVRDSCYTGGLDMHQTRGWVVRDNHVEGFWCDEGLAEHGIHLWRANAESLIVRNTVHDCARGIGIGLTDSPTEVRDHDIEGCDQSATYYDDLYGVIVNNVVTADEEELFASSSGFDSGIGVYAACEATVLHNTVYSTQAPFSSLEWRFEASSGRVENNLVSHTLRERTTDTLVAAGNIEGATAADFISVDEAVLHLAEGSSAIDAGVVTELTEDIDGETRDERPDVGADER